MIVDDEPAVLTLMKDLAEAQNLEVHSFLDPVKALEALAVHKADFSAILTDIRMPILDGIEFIQRARQMQFDLPIVVVSGHLDQSLTIDALKMGAFDFIAKPFDLDRFENIVQQAVSNGDEIRKLFAEIERQFSKESPDKIELLKKTRQVLLNMRKPSGS